MPSRFTIAKSDGPSKDEKAAEREAYAAELDHWREYAVHTYLSRDRLQMYVKGGFAHVVAELDAALREQRLAVFWVSRPDQTVSKHVAIDPHGVTASEEL